MRIWGLTALAWGDRSFSDKDLILIALGPDFFQEFIRLTGDPGSDIIIVPCPYPAVKKFVALLWIGYRKK